MAITASVKQNYAGDYQNHTKPGKVAGLGLEDVNRDKECAKSSKASPNCVRNSKWNGFYHDGQQVERKPVTDSHAKGPIKLGETIRELECSCANEFENDCEQ